MRLTPKLVGGALLAVALFAGPAAADDAVEAVQAAELGDMDTVVSLLDGMSAEEIDEAEAAALFEGLVVATPLTPGSAKSWSKVATFATACAVENDAASAEESVGRSLLAYSSVLRARAAAAAGGDADPADWTRAADALWAIFVEEEAPEYAAASICVLHEATAWGGPDRKTFSAAAKERVRALGKKQAATREYAMRWTRGRLSTGAALLGTERKEAKAAVKSAFAPLRPFTAKDADPTERRHAAKLLNRAVSFERQQGFALREH